MTIDNLHDLDGLTEQDRKVLIQFVPGTPYPVGTLAALTGIDSYDVTAIVAVLNKRGFIRPGRFGSSKVWTLTDAGAGASLQAASRG